MIAEDFRLYAKYDMRHTPEFAFMRARNDQRYTHTRSRWIFCYFIDIDNFRA